MALSEFNNTADTTADYDAKDIADNKVYAILSYLGLLFLVPIFAAPNSKFARFHANQGILAFIVLGGWSVINFILLSILEIVFPETNVVNGSYSHGLIYALLTSVLQLVYIIPVVLIIIGIVNAAKGRVKELPFIGKFRILK